jgi:hypothetical protein
MASGAYVDWEASALVEYCVNVAKGVKYADYQPDRDSK